MSKPKVTINLDKTSKLKFENSITGTNLIPKSFFKIPITETMSLLIEGDDKREGDKVISEIEIPPLKDFIKETKIVENAELNIKVSKSLFVPWKGILELKRPLEVESCLKEAKIEVDENDTPQITSSLQEVEEVVEEACKRRASKNKSKKKKKFSGFAKMSEGYI